MMQPLFYREQIKGYTEQMVACTERRLERWEAGDTRDMETEMRSSLLKFCSQPCSVVNWFLERIKSFAMPLMVSNEWFTPSLVDSPPLASDTVSRRRFTTKGAASTGSSEPPAEEGSQSVSPSVADDGVAGGGQQRPEESSSNMDPSNLLTQLQRIRNSDDGEQLD